MHVGERERGLYALLDMSGILSMIEVVKMCTASDSGCLKSSYTVAPSASLSEGRPATRQHP